MKTTTRILSGALGVALLSALAVGVQAEEASAHTGDLHVTASCNTATGEYDFAAVLDIKQTNLTGTASYRVGTPNFEGTPRNANGMTDSIPVAGTATYPLTTFSLPGTTTGLGPWVYAHTTFSDGYKIGSDGQLRTPLSGDCKRDKPTEPPVKRVPGSETLPPDCVTKEVVTKNWEDVTTYAFDEDKWDYVATTVRVHKPDTRVAITDEQAAVCAGDQPEVKIVRELVKTGDVACGDTTRTDIYKVTTTGSTRVGTEWVDSEPVVTEESVVVTLDPKDVKLCPTPTPTPTPEPEGEELVVTGVEDWNIPAMLGGLVTAALAGGFIIWMYARRRNTVTE